MQFTQMLKKDETTENSKNLNNIIQTPTKVEFKQKQRVSGTRTEGKAQIFNTVIERKCR